MPAQTKKYYTVKEVAKLLGFSTNTVYKYLDESKIKSVRLGEEGRFRIPADEVNKFAPEEVITPSPVSKNGLTELGLSRNLNAPSLFDWFTSILAISLGAVEFLFPVYSLNPSFLHYLGVIKILKAALVVFGVLLVSQDIFEAKKKTWHKILHILLSLNFVAIAVILILIGQLAHSVDYSIIAVVLLVTTFWKINEYIKFVIYINLITIFSGIFALLQSRVAGSDLFLDWILQNNVIFLIVWMLIVIATLVCGFLAIKKQKGVALVFCLCVSLASLAFSVITFSSGSWERSVLLVVIASFSLLFPYWSVFENYTLKSKRQLSFAYFWLSAFFVVGFLTLFIVNKNFESQVLTEVQKRLDTAANYVDDFVSDGETKVMVFSQDGQLNSLITEGKNKPEDYESVLKEFFMSSSGAFRRIVYVNKKGTEVSTYPVLSSAIGVDISARDYFTGPKSGDKIFNSGIIQPSVPGVPPAVLISAPILSPSGEFLGTITGSVDLSNLADKLGQIKFGQNGNFELIDSKKYYILNPDPSKIMTSVKAETADLAAVNGFSGTIIAYDSSGELSLQAYKPVTTLKWGLVAQQPYSDAFAAYNIVGFVVFLISVISGFVSLILIIHFSKNKQIG